MFANNRPAASFLQENTMSQAFPALDRQLPATETAALHRPLLIWDGNCGFCHYWVLRWRQMTGDSVAYEPYQDVAHQFSITTEEFKRAAFLVEPDGEVFRGMGAAFRTFTYGNRWGFLFRWYNRSRLFRRLMDRVYRWIAEHRPFLFRLTKLVFGKNPRA